MAYTDHPYRFDGFLFLDRPEVVFKARINAASFSYPIASVAIDTITVGSAADLVTGRTILFGTTDGSDDLGRSYVRRSSTSTLLNFGESSTGIHDGEVLLADNAFVTVLNEHRVWTIAPRIDDSDNLFKLYDIPYLDAGRNYGSRPGPIANGGPFKIKLINTVTGVATFTFSAADAYMVTPSSTKTGQAWVVQDGTITVGSSTSEAMTATFPVGRRYVTLTVTDSNGDTHTRYILVVALSLTDATWKPIFDFEITSGLRLAPDGAEMSVIINEDLAPNTFPDGAAVLYFEREFYNDVEGSLAGPTGAENVKFVGWSDLEVEQVEGTERGLRRGVEFRCISSAERLRRLNLLPQQVESDATPDDWTEMLTLTDFRLIFYLLKWHSTALDVAPLLFNINWVAEVALAGWNTTAADLYGQVDEVAAARGGRLTCDQRGQLRREDDPNLQDSAFRIDEVIVALSSADYYDAYGLERDRHPRDYWMDGLGIVAGEDGDPAFCIAPGVAPGQGSQRSDLSKQIVESQTELNSRTGHAYAQVNAPYLPFSFKLSNWGDIGIEPALMKWITITIPANTNRRSRTFTDERFLPTEVSINYTIDDQGRRGKEVEVTVTVETEGEPATTVVYPKGDANYPPITLPVITFPNFDFDYGDFGRGIGNVAVWSYNNDYIFRTSNFYTPAAANGPTWTQTDLGAGLGGSNIIDFIADRRSPLYIGTGATVNGWIITGGSGVGNSIKRVTDIFGACTLTNRHTLRPFVFTKADIAAPFLLGSQNRVYAAYRTRAGVYYSYTTDDSTYTKGPQPIGGVSIGASLEALSIPVDGTTVTTATTLTSGVYYLLRITGTAQKNAVGPLLMDAVYHETSPATWVQSNNGVGSNLVVAADSASENCIPVSDVYDGATHSYDFILIGTGATRTLGARQYGAAQTGTWSATLYPYNYPVGTVNYPGLYGSSKVDGKVYASAYAGAAGDGYSSSNQGATFAALGSPDINPDDDLAGCIHVPYANNDNELVVYHGLYDTTGTVRKLIRIESDGSTKTDVSPTISATKYGPSQAHQIDTWQQDRRYVLAFGANAAASQFAGWVSADHGASWTLIQALTGTPPYYSGGVFSSNNYNAMYLWGPQAIGYSEDFGQTIDSRIGNILDDFGTPSFCAMVGG